MVRSLTAFGVTAAAMIGGAAAFAPVSTIVVRSHQRTAMSPLQVVADAPVIEQDTERRSTLGQDLADEMLTGERWHLILHNDKQNTKEWVAHALHFVVGLSEEKAYHIMQAAHKDGKACVGTYIRDVAECYKQGMCRNGIKCDVVPSEGSEDFQ